MRTRNPIVVLGACAVIGLGVAGCGDDDDQSSKSGGGTELTADTKKVVKESTALGGLEGTKRGMLEGGGSARALQPGETLDISALDDHIVSTIKQKTGIDVRAECPPNVQYAPGAVFFCKIYLPDGTSMDVKCTQQENGIIQWELVTTDPTPQPQPDDPNTRELEGAKADDPVVRGAAARGLNPGDILDLTTLEDAIEQTLKQKTGLDLTVICPTGIQYSPGSTFYCKLQLTDGTVYDVECTQQENATVAWRVITS